MSTLVFYAPNCKIMPIMEQNIDEKLHKLNIGESIESNGLKFTICSSSDIPDSRNKFGRMGNNVKCVLVYILDDNK